MDIKCTPEELKELIQNKTPVAGTTDVVPIVKIGDKEINHCKKEKVKFMEVM